MATEEQVFGEAPVGLVPVELDPEEDVSWHRKRAVADDADATQEGEDPELGMLTNEVRHARWQARKPVIEHLTEGIVKVPATDDSPEQLVPLFSEGERIVVECRSAFLNGSPWIYTLVGKVVSIDDESGEVRMFDEESDRAYPKTRLVSFHSDLFRFRLAPPRGNPFNVTLAKAHERKLAAEVKAQEAGEPVVKKGRGRPAGQKNRPKEVIKAEKEAYRQAMIAKKAARKARR